MIHETDRREVRQSSSILSPSPFTDLYLYHLDEMFSARQEQFRAKVGDVDGEEDEERGEGVVVREGVEGDIKGEEVVVLVLARVGGGGEGTLQDTSA